MSTEIIAARAYPVVGRNFNTVCRVGVFSRHSAQNRSASRDQEFIDSFDEVFRSMGSRSFARRFVHRRRVSASRLRS